MISITRIVIGVVAGIPLLLVIGVAAVFAGLRS